MKVKNINGSSRFAKPTGYSSWLDYWVAQKGYRPTYCSETSCLGIQLVGAHVQKVNSTDQQWYIVPLCSSCNQRTDTFDVPADKLVPVPSNL